MFVYTMKASGIKFFVAVAVSVALLAALIAILPAVSAQADAASVSTDFKHIDSETDMIEFLRQFGYEVDPVPVDKITVIIPEEFNSAFEKYNDIQRAQGLNLKRYAGKDATVYTFKVMNYGTDDEVYATLFIRNERVIAGDICSPSGEGFVHGFKKPVTGVGNNK